MSKTAKSQGSLLTLEEVALYLNVSSKTVYYWVGRAEIPFIRVGRHLRFDPATVVQHFSGKTEAADPAIACRNAKAALRSGSRAWSLKTGAGLADS